MKAGKWRRFGAPRIRLLHRTSLARCDRVGKWRGIYRSLSLVFSQRSDCGSRLGVGEALP